MRSFRDISIGYKTLVPPVIMMVALGSVLLLTIHGFDKQVNVISSVNEIALQRNTLLNRFILLSERVQSDLFLVSVMRFMEVPDEEVVPIHDHLEQGLSNLEVIYYEILSKWPLDATEKETLKQMKIPLDDFSKQARQAADVVSKNPSFGILLVRSAAFPFARFRKLLTKFMDYQNNKILQAETVARHTARDVKTTTLIISITMSLISILLTALIGNRFISRPVRNITAIMERLALGDLSAHITERGRGDEIGSMAAAVEVFRENAIEKQAAEKAQRESEEKYRILFESSRDASFITTWEGNIVEANPSHLDLFGYSREEISDWNAKDTYVNPDDRSRFRKEIEENGSVKDFAVKLRKKDGTEMDCLITATVQRSKEGSIVGYQGIIRDITKLKRAQEERERIISELQEALAKVKTLSGLLPICAHCKRVRDDQGYWNQIEAYIRDHSEAEFSHCICPECMKKHFPEFCEDD